MKVESFWEWLIKPRGRGKTGVRLLLSWWLVVDVFVATVALNYLRVDGFEFASKALFPAASILVSMAIAWTARATTIINDKNFREKVVSDDRPLEDYIYGYQLSLLVIMATVIYISIMAVGGLKFSVISEDFSVRMSTFVLYFLLSMSVRLCWGVINFSNLLGISNSRIN